MPERKVETKRALFLLVGYLVLAIYLLPMFPHGGSANELSRWATAASLVEKGTFDIKWTEDLIGRNVDTAKVGENIYSNKPPGTAIIAAPIYAVTAVFLGPPNESNIRVSWFVMRLFISTLPLLFLGIWLFKHSADEFALAVILFATPLFLYSLLFFSHVFVAVLLFFAYRLIYESGSFSAKNCLRGGLLCGLAVVSEFPVIVCVLVFGAGLWFTEKKDRFRNLFAFAAGGIPFAVILLFYNYSLFGSPFSMSYAFESFPEWAEVAGEGVFGVGFPTLSNAYLLLISPSRGLLFSSPILVLAFVAAFLSREKWILKDRVRLTAIVVSIVVMCGHGAAHGGWAFGARYLVFILPLVLIPFFESKPPAFPALLKGGLLSVSILLSVIPSFTFPFAPPEFQFPHNDYWGKFLVVENWFTPTFANVIGLPSNVWTMLPVFILVLAVFWVVARSSERQFKCLMGLIIGVIAVGIYSFVPGLDSREGQFRRATIAERFYRPADRMREFKLPGTAVSISRVENVEWEIAETLGNGPDNFPYLNGKPLSERPSQVLKQAVELQKQGKFVEAERLIRDGSKRYPFGKCIFLSNLAVLYYSSNRKEDALTELEAIKNDVGPESLPACMRSQFLLGSLYREMNETQKSNKAFQEFIQNSNASKDPDILGFRKQLGVK